MICAAGAEYRIDAETWRDVFVAMISFADPQLPLVLANGNASTATQGLAVSERKALVSEVL